MTAPASFQGAFRSQGDVKASHRKKTPSPAAGARRLVWTRRAVADLEAMGDYIARDKPAAAERWVLRLMSVAEKAATIPLAGRRVPELGRDEVRETFTHSYRIVYRVTAEQVQVLTVFESHRLFPKDRTPPSAHRPRKSMSHVIAGRIPPSCCCSPVFGCQVAPTT